MLVYGAYLLGIIPLAWLAWLAARGKCPDAAWWWLAGAYFVSFLADTAALMGVDPWLPSLVYPVSQAALIGAVLLERTQARTFVIVLVLTGLAAVLWLGVGSPDVLVHTVAWLGVALVVYNRDALGRLRTALLVSFGWGWLAWVGYAIAPGWPAWFAYQSVRAVGIGSFCMAAMNPTPRLKVLA
jgi:hypothetical protein